MPIRRYFSEDNLKRVSKDFKFMLNMVRESCGEYDFAIRDNYFNIYYQGNSIAKVTPNRSSLYTAEINKKFFTGTKADDPKYYLRKSDGEKVQIKLNARQLHPFFKKNHISDFSSRVRKVNNGEEINFEQALITDNMNREEYIIIDRQTTDTVLNRKRMDLLALRQVTGNKYNFEVVEVKLGKNEELKNAVISQLNFYVSHISNNFKEYKNCFETNYVQKKKLGLIEVPKFESIEIVEDVKGIIVVGGYFGLGLKHIIELKENHPSANVNQFRNVL